MIGYVGRDLLRFFAGSLLLGVGVGLTLVTAHAIYKSFTEENKTKIPQPQYENRNNP